MTNNDRLDNLIDTMGKIEKYSRCKCLLDIRLDKEFIYRTSIVLDSYFFDKYDDGGTQRHITLEVAHKRFRNFFKAIIPHLKEIREDNITRAKESALESQKMLEELEKLSPSASPANDK